MRNSPKNTDDMFVQRRAQQPFQRRPSMDGVSGHMVPNSADKKIAKGVPVLRRNPAAELPQPAANNRGASSKPIDIDLTLDDEDNGKGKQKRRWRLKKPSKRTVKWIAIALLVLILALAGYFAYKLFIASSNIFKGGGDSSLVNGGIDKNKLQHEGDGRVNVLLAATSEDDPAHQNSGATLTDSIMIASIDPVNKGATLISIPRDLWVKMPGCSMFSQQKINAAYECGQQIGFKESGYPDGGMGYLQKIVEGVSGLNINYYAKINYTAFRQGVDAVGGIDITISSSDPRGILDRNFDWICNYKCSKVKWPNGPAHLDGEHALYLARARNDPGAYPGYGLPRGDFDRTENQRKMLIALEEKATSVATLSNPVKLSNLIDSIGNNLVTNFSRKDMLSLYSVAKDIAGDKIRSISLADKDKPVVTTGNVSGASVVRPIAGLFDYSEVQLYIRATVPDPYIANEAPSIALYNGTGVAGLAGKHKEILESYGYKVAIMETAPTTEYIQNVFYDTTKGQKQVTKQYLQNRFKTKARSDALPEGIKPIVDPATNKIADFVIILGTDAAN